MAQIVEYPLAMQEFDPPALGRNGLGRSPGKGNGNPLQYSWLGSPIDRGAWWATVHGVIKVQTGLSNKHFHQILRVEEAWLFCLPPQGRLFCWHPLEASSKSSSTLWLPLLFVIHGLSKSVLYSHKLVLSVLRWKKSINFIFQPKLCSLISPNH